MTTTDAPPAIAILTNRYLHASFLRHAVLPTSIVAGLVLAFSLLVNSENSHFFSVPVFVLFAAFAAFFTTLFDHPGIFSANSWAGLSRSETVWAWTGWLIAHALLVCAIAGVFYLVTPDAVLAAENSTTVMIDEFGTTGTTREERDTFSSLDAVFLSVPITLSALASGLAVVVSFMVFSRLIAFVLLLVTSPFVYTFVPMPVDVTWQVLATLAVAVVHFVFAMLFVCTSNWRS